MCPKIVNIFLKIFWGNFFWNFFCENAERSVAFGECE
jgi:hypothetical protein